MGSTTQMDQANPTTQLSWFNLTTNVPNRQGNLNGLGRPDDPKRSYQLDDPYRPIMLVKVVDLVWSNPTRLSNSSVTLGSSGQPNLSRLSNPYKSSGRSSHLLGRLGPIYILCVYGISQIIIYKNIYIFFDKHKTGFFLHKKLSHMAI